MLVDTIYGKKSHDDSQLLKTVYVQQDTDDLKVTWVEYCLPSCREACHATGVPDGSTVFCLQHIHHSVDVVIKRSLVVLGTELGQFPG